MKRESKKLGGVIPATLTAWNSKGEIDEEKTTSYLQYLIDRGVSGIFCGGSMGEAGLMTMEQRKKIIDIGVEAAKGKVPVIAGTWHNCTRIAIELSKYAEAAGADVAMAALPHYPKTTQEGLYEHYKAIAEAVRIPVFVYSWLGQFGIEMEPETVARLAKGGYIQGIKYSTADILAVGEIIRLTEGKITILLGAETIFLAGLCLGADGCMGVSPAVVPEETVKMYNLLQEGKIEEAAKQQLNTLPFYKFLTHNDTRDDVPLLKEAVKMLGQDLGELQLPFVKVPPDTKEGLRQELRRLGKLK